MEAVSEVYRSSLVERIHVLGVSSIIVMLSFGLIINTKKKREGKVLRVLPSGRWVPRNQG